MDFNLAAAVNGFDLDKDYEVTDIDAKLESAIQLLANPETLNYDNDLFENMLELAHAMPQLPRSQRKQLVYLVTSGVQQVASQVANAVTHGHVDDIDLKILVEKFSYLIYVVLKWLSKEELPRQEQRKKLSNMDEHIVKINNHQVEDALQAVTAVISISHLDKMFVSSTERDQFVELFTRPTINLMEDPDRMKRLNIRQLIFKILALSVQFHNHHAIIRHSVTQLLQYFHHLAPHLAELLVLIANTYNYPKLTEDVLLEIGNSNFDAADTNGPKQVAELIVSLSQLAPRLVSRQLAAVSQLLENNNMHLRNAVVESCGNIVLDMIHVNAEEQDNSLAPATDGLLQLLEERLYDVHFLVRSKAVQAITKVSDSSLKQPKRRLKWLALAVNQLDDKSTVVRRNSIKLMNSLVSNHKYPGSRLSLIEWTDRHEKAKETFEQVSRTSTSQGESGGNDMEVDKDSDVESAFTMSDQFNEEIVRARLTLELCDDAICFIRLVVAGTEKVSKLLFSKSKLETIESMDFLVLVEAHGIEESFDGIRRMLHLVWSKATTDENSNAITVVGHLIECYRQLFLSPPPTAMEQQAQYMAKNLIELTFGASASDLASLERLLGLLYDANHIPPSVVDTLWAIYSSQNQRAAVRSGSIIILGMIASVDNQVVVKHIEDLVAGLSESDFILRKYTSVALQRLIPNDAAVDQVYKIPHKDQIINGLRNVLLESHRTAKWFSVAEEAISAIFTLCPEADELCTEIIKVKTKAVFEGGDPASSDLAQLLYIVGDVAIKLMVSLEAHEAMFKKKKHDLDIARAQGEHNEEQAQQQELEMIGGTSEDDFTDAVTHVKEREVLYGEKSLCSRYGPLVVEICSNNHVYNHPDLQRSATLCLSKLMCISSIFCEENLGLFITIMEKSTDPLIRCNCVLGLGDMAVCFNNIVDERTDFLYRRLNDEDITVQRTCLMTVTFLILAGQVKVKGQLSSMAKCLMDSDPTIADMCRLFFTELSTKDNAIYNAFIDMFSGLSADLQLNRDSFKKIMRYLVGFIDKEKQQRQLAEKLLNRLNASESKQQWDDVAFVLGILPYKSDEIQDTISEGFKYAQRQDPLSEDVDLDI
ncbi:hypothetical protein DIURU_001918 [Diutina rugosa]|uniref:Condensin complex subunit 1 n=1 Tax=Diutina rugosa TaxID=5481 RepID=A0A642USA5_DIURU|nr:uncharacterized protein DIURU_001918 [Diutina rugosa]KAA8904337.1 hypothetical protein DIURU_001918 [Diutina rugosa]